VTLVPVRRETAARGGRTEGIAGARVAAFAADRVGAVVGRHARTGSPLILAGNPPPAPAPASSIDREHHGHRGDTSSWAAVAQGRGYAEGEGEGMRRARVRPAEGMREDCKSDARGEGKSSPSGGLPQSCDFAD